MRNFLALALVAACAACGSDNNSNNGNDAGNDFAVSFDLAQKLPDLAVPADLATPPDFSGINCGSMTCSAGNVCCAMQNGGTATYMCATSCADGGIMIGCDGPDNCKTGSDNLCCATITTNGGTPPACNLQAVSGCTNTCTTNVPFSCNSQGTVRLCHRGSDCASDTNNPYCCLFTYNGNNVTFCANQQLKMSIAAMCFN
ncbi:MAG TPA: hypothetical protein VFF06_30845 [Polyangia bacterium]|nr:hypothetical protein [Polyangia bacterium]